MRGVLLIPLLASDITPVVCGIGRRQSSVFLLEQGFRHTVYMSYICILAENCGNRRGGCKDMERMNGV